MGWQHKKGAGEIDPSVLEEKPKLIPGSASEQIAVSDQREKPEDEIPKDGRYLAG